MTYEESGRAKDFVLDLLKLHVKELLAIDVGEGIEQEKTGEDVQKSFKQFLQNFIRRNALKHGLLKEMSIMMVYT